MAPRLSGSARPAALEPIPTIPLEPLWERRNQQTGGEQAPQAAACPIPCVPGGKVVDRRAGQSLGPTRARRAVGAILVQCLIGRWRFSVAIGSGESDIEAVLDTLARKRWNLHRLQKPADLHVNFRQGHPQAADPGAFLADPRRAVERFRCNPQEEGTMGVVDGLAGSTPVKSLVAGVNRNFIDWMHRVD